MCFYSITKLKLPHFTRRKDLLTCYNSSITIVHRLIVVASCGEETRKRVLFVERKKVISDQLDNKLIISRHCILINFFLAQYWYKQLLLNSQNLYFRFGMNIGNKQLGGLFNGMPSHHMLSNQSQNPQNNDLIKLIQQEENKFWSVRPLYVLSTLQMMFGLFLIHI